MFNVYIGKSVYPREENAYTIGYSKDNTRRAYTKHMKILYSYAFDTKAEALRCEKHLLKYAEELGYERAFVRYNPDELKSRPNRTWDWFYVPTGKRAEFEHDINNMLGAFHLTNKLWYGKA